MYKQKSISHPIKYPIKITLGYQSYSMLSCISNVITWATANMPKLNDIKTELSLVTSKGTKHLHNLPTSITIGNAQIPFKHSIKNI